MKQSIRYIILSLLKNTFFCLNENDSTLLGWGGIFYFIPVSYRYLICQFLWNRVRCIVPYVVMTHMSVNTSFVLIQFFKSKSYFEYCMESWARFGFFSSGILTYICMVSDRRIITICNCAELIWEQLACDILVLCYEQGSQVRHQSTVKYFMLSWTYDRKAAIWNNLLWQKFCNAICSLHLMM